jgi:hypothetical protein
VKGADMALIQSKRLCLFFCHGSSLSLRGYESYSMSSLHFVQRSWIAEQRLVLCVQKKNPARKSSPRNSWKGAPCCATPADGRVPNGGDPTDPWLA